MSGRSLVFSATASAAVALLAVSLFHPPAARAQRPDEPPVLAAGSDRASSAFQLFAEADLAATGSRMSAEFSGCADNSGNLTTNTQCWNNFRPSPYFMPDWFDMFFYVAAPPSERNKHAGVVPSLLNANNKGYTVNSALSQYSGELLPADGSLGLFHSGVTDSGAGDCADHRELSSGTVLLAASDCGMTWGSLGWRGSRPVTGEGYRRYGDRVGGMNLSFDPWRVPADLHEADRYLGSFQSFGLFTDYGDEALFGSASAYNNVVPGIQDPATRSGWPLGMQVKMDFFTFPDVLDLRNVAFYQITVTNNSRAVYGVGLDYDSLYMGLQPGWYTYNDGTALYRDPANGVTRGATMCHGFTNSSSQGTSGNGCGPGGDPFHLAAHWGPSSSVGAGFHYGAAAIVVLKSPIGDLRNKLFTDPASPFFGQGDPEAWDDTITFNHGHMCGFHGCSAVTWNAPASTLANSDYEQRQFGMVASITEDVLGDRLIGDVAAHTRWDTWRWEEYPDANQLDFNKWVPGGWDYDDDGVADTLFFDDCSDNAGPQYDPFTGNEKRCAVTWSDTIVAGFGNVYPSRGAVTGVGPFALAADSTTGFVFGIVMASSLADIEAALDFTVHSYRTFFDEIRLAAAPAPRIVSFDVESDREAGEPAGRATVYIDDAAEEWEDPYLSAGLERLRSAAPGSPIASVAALNPFLEDTIESRIGDNVAAVHIFKSCDGGASYTADSDCRGDPARDGKFAGLGWYPYKTIPAGSGTITNSFVVDSLFTGQDYQFALVAETRGLTVQVITGVADTAVTAGGDTVVTCVADCQVRELTVAPVVFSKLSADPAHPHVASLYASVSRQPGASAASFQVVQPSPDLIPIERTGLRATSDTVLDGGYRLLFVDSVTATEYWRLTGSGEELVETVVRAVDLGGVPQVFTAPGAVGVEGAHTDTIVGDQRIRVYPFGGFGDDCTFHYELRAVLLDADSVPLLVTDELGGGQSAPGRYFGLPNFPGFTISIDNSLCGTFEAQSYLDADGQPLEPADWPSVAFVPSQSEEASESFYRRMGGRYRLTWSDAAFGPGAPFSVDRTEPEAAREAVLTSLDSRAVASTASTDPELAAALFIDPGSMIPVELPFVIEDVTDPDDPVPLRIVVRDFNKRTSLTLGTGSDTVTVAVPGTVWLPGDELWVVAGPDTAVEHRFRYAVIGCDPARWQTSACNPAAGDDPDVPDHVPTRAGQQLQFSYYQRFSAETEYVFDARSALTGQRLLGDAARIRAALDSVKVVPNPFVVASRYDAGSVEPFVLFTHVPPNGRIRIYTVSGQFVQVIRWGPNDLNGRGDLRFNLLTRGGLEMAAGLYLYVLEAKDAAGGTIGVKKGKFVLIR